MTGLLLFGFASPDGKGIATNLSNVSPTQDLPLQKEGKGDVALSEGKGDVAYWISYTVNYYILYMIVHEQQVTSITHSLITALKQQVAALQYNLSLPVPGGQLMVKPAEIIRLQADGSYRYFFLEDGNKLLVTQGMFHFKRNLPDLDLSDVIISTWLIAGI